MRRLKDVRGYPEYPADFLTSRSGMKRGVHVLLKRTYGPTIKTSGCARIRTGQRERSLLFCFTSAPSLGLFKKVTMPAAHLLSTKPRTGPVPLSARNKFLPGTSGLVRNREFQDSAFEHRLQILSVHVVL